MSFTLTCDVLPPAYAMLSHRVVRFVARLTLVCSWRSQVYASLVNSARRSELDIVSGRLRNGFSSGHAMHSRRSHQVRGASSAGIVDRRSLPQLVMIRCVDLVMPFCLFPSFPRKKANYQTIVKEFPHSCSVPVLN